MAHQHIIDHFCFASDPGTEGFIAEVPTGIKSKWDLLNAQAEVLNFPDYFGMNWDALVDCLGDFHWMKEYRITLFHRDLPDLNTEDLKTYLDVLAHDVAEWKARKEKGLDERKLQFSLHELRVIFPPHTMGFILNILNERLH